MFRFSKGENTKWCYTCIGQLTPIWGSLIACGRAEWAWNIQFLIFSHFCNLLLITAKIWWKTEVVPQPFRIRYRSALWLRSNFLNPSEFPPCILTCSKKFLPWGWAIRWAISWDVRGIWTIGPTKCHSLSERPPDLSVPQCVTLSVWERRNNFLTQSAEVSNANAH